MNDEALSVLEKNVVDANRAEHAYDTYFKKFIDFRRVSLYNDFCKDTAVGSQKLLEIASALNALGELELAILSDIETGKMALLQLENS